MSDEINRLYGLDGAELLDSEIEEAAERNAYGRSEGDVIELCEYTVKAPGSHFPDAEMVAEYIDECVMGSETDEGFSEQAAAALADPEVRALLTAALDLAATKVGYRMADRVVATFAVTYTLDGYVIGERAEASR